MDTALEELDPVDQVLAPVSEAPELTAKEFHPADQVSAPESEAPELTDKDFNPVDQQLDNPMFQEPMARD